MRTRLNTLGLLWLLIASAATIAAVSGAAAAQRTVRGPWLLTALPGMGTVTWRCDPARKPALALGLNASAATATETLTFRAGGKTLVHRVMQPGDRLDLPYVRFSRQQLTIVQHTEPGILKAAIAVDFSPRPVSPSHCAAYLPPALVVHVFPR